MKRYATATWEGTGKQGIGKVSTPGGVLHEAHFSFYSRFDEEPGTNPEELMAAALATCFIMKLSFVLAEAGFASTLLQADAYISMEYGIVNAAKLVVEAKVAGIQQAVFNNCVQEAILYCPISNALQVKPVAEAVLHNQDNMYH